VLYIGLDVHRRRTPVAVLDESGHELFNRNVPNDRERLGEAPRGAEPGTPIVFEAAYGWSWLAELLHEMGFEVHLAHARACKAIAHARLKNDRVDARTLAHLLRAGLLPEAWIAPRPVKELRMLLRHRASLVRQRTLLKTRIRAVLADRGIDAPVALWDGPGPASNRTKPGGYRRAGSHAGASAAFEGVGRSHRAGRAGSAGRRATPSHHRRHPAPPGCRRSGSGGRGAL